MNELNTELQSELVELVKNINENGLAALDFAKDEAPEVVNQLLIWGYVGNIMSVVIGIASAAFTVWIYKKLCKKKQAAGYLDGDGWVFLVILSAMFSFVALTLAVRDLFVLVKIMCAPKVWLIGEISALI